MSADELEEVLAHMREARRELDELYAVMEGMLARPKRERKNGTG